MADEDEHITMIDAFYNAVSPESQFLSRPCHRKRLTGQASFFALTARLGVPVLNSGKNMVAGIDQIFAGSGASFGVSRSLLPLREDGERLETIETRKQMSDARYDNNLPTRRFVAKRINPASSINQDDSIQLAAITNEMRVLATKSLRECDQLVRLLCVAWDEQPTHGRYWPRLLLECADHGNLADYFQQQDTPIGWDTKMSLTLDILSGLNTLHLHNVAHCDLKFENVLIFHDPAPAHASVNIKAKLCDFGFSVIVSDYEEEFCLEECMGTPPWNAPEVAIGLQSQVKDLPKSDIYSFGLLASRVCLDGKSPFEGLSRSEIRDLKEARDGDDKTVLQKVTSTIVSSGNFNGAHIFGLENLFMMTLSRAPQRRVPLHIIGAYIVILSVLAVLFRE